MRLPLLLTLALATHGPAAAADPVKHRVELQSDRLGALGLPLAESQTPVHRVVITADVDNKGDGRGTLTLELTDPPAYDEFGFVTGFAPYRELKLDCTLKLAKITTKVSPVRRRPGLPPGEAREARAEWWLYAVTGPKVTSRLFLATAAEQQWRSGRLLVQGADGKVKHVVDLSPLPQPEPCHPGCFPAGTPVRVPGGTRPVEALREGDTVTTVGADGTPATAAVTGLFVTRNRLLEVRTDGGTLTTTETQPLALEGGGFRPAGELTAGDRVWRWDGAARRAVSVREVTAAAREAEVFNLVLGGPTAFVAGDFLVRSKPPAAAAAP